MVMLTKSGRSALIVYSDRQTPETHVGESFGNFSSAKEERPTRRERVTEGNSAHGSQHCSRDCCGGRHRSGHVGRAGRRDAHARVAGEGERGV